MPREDERPSFDDARLDASRSRAVSSSLIRYITQEEMPCMAAAKHYRSLRYWGWSGAGVARWIDPGARMEFIATRAGDITAEMKRYRRQYCIFRPHY